MNGFDFGVGEVIGGYSDEDDGGQYADEGHECDEVILEGFSVSVDDVNNFEAEE